MHMNHSLITVDHRETMTRWLRAAFSSHIAQRPRFPAFLGLPRALALLETVSRVNK